MSVCIVTSGFPRGFTEEFIGQVKAHLPAGMRFAFVA